MAIRRVRAVVSGRVQGVFYRASTEGEARRRGLGGWVRNLPDGRVEMEVEGESAVVEDLLAWARRGPEMASVTGLDVGELTPVGEREFSVRR